LNDAERTIAAIFRIELPKLVAGLARVVRDVGRAEELAQDAMVIALERWPGDGVPSTIITTNQATPWADGSPRWSSSRGRRRCGASRR
jgi:hypothetical protein